MPINQHNSICYFNRAKNNKGVAAGKMKISIKICSLCTISREPS